VTGRHVVRGAVRASMGLPRNIPKLLQSKYPQFKTTDAWEKVIVSCSLVIARTVGRKSLQIGLDWLCNETGTKTGRGHALDINLGWMRIKRRWFWESTGGAYGSGLFTVMDKLRRLPSHGLNADRD